MKLPHKRHVIATSATVVGVAAITLPMTMVLADESGGQSQGNASCAITPLPGPDGNKSGAVTAVSSNGEYMAGHADEQAVLWHDDDFTELGTESEVVDVNSEGVVLGRGDHGAAEPGPWKWVDGEFTSLEVPEVDGDSVEPTAINDSGEIVGNSGTYSDDYFMPIVALQWTADSSEATVLELEEEKGEATDISDDGKIVGSQRGGEDGPVRPWIWNDEGAEELPATPADDDGDTGAPIHISGDFALSDHLGADSAHYVWDLASGQVIEEPLEMRTANGVDEQGRVYGEEFDDSEITYAAVETEEGLEKLPLLKDEFGEGDRGVVHGASLDGTVLAGAASAEDSATERAVMWTGCS